MVTRFLIPALLIATLASGTAQAFEYTDADIEIDAVDYSGISDASRWFATGDGGMYTAWGNNWLEFTAYLDVGEWNVGINAINQGNLGENWYSEFEVRNSFGNTVMQITASDTEVNNAYVTAQVDMSDYYTVRYTWLNDKYDPSCDPGRDANIEIKNAFFDNTATGTGSVPLPSVPLLLAIGALAGLSRRTNGESVERGEAK